jgi:hypothetical protein
MSSTNILFVSIRPMISIPNHAGMTATCSHGGREWDEKLRNAVARLDQPFRLSYRLAYGRKTVIAGMMQVPDFLSNTGIATDFSRRHGRRRRPAQPFDARRAVWVGRIQYSGSLPISVSKLLGIPTFPHPFSTYPDGSSRPLNPGPSGRWNDDEYNTRKEQEQQRRQRQSQPSYELPAAPVTKDFNVWKDGKPTLCTQAKQAVRESSGCFLALSNSTHPPSSF